MPKEPNVWPAAEVARLKGVSRQAVASAAGRGTLNAEKVGRSLLVYRDAKLRAYLEDAPQPGTAAPEPSDDVSS